MVKERSAGIALKVAPDDDHGDDDKHADEERAHIEIAQAMAEERADHRIGVDERHVRLAHDAQVHGKQRNHRQDRCEQVEDLEAHVEHGGDHAGRSPRRHGDQRRQPGIDARDDQHCGHRGAKRKRAVDGQIRKIDGSDDAGGEPSQEREAEIELAWLRKEVEDLREQLAVARGQPALGETFVQDRARWVRLATALTAALVCGFLAKRV